MEERREGTVHSLENGTRDVIIVDRGEDFEDKAGEIPNHDKVEIIYVDK